MTDSQDRALGKSETDHNLPALTLFDQMCTETEDCRALADAHRNSCPVEQELRNVFGF